MAVFKFLPMALLAGILATTAVADEFTSKPQAYTAVYKVLRNGIELAAVTIELSQQQDVWTLHGFTHDTRGLAKFLNIKGTQKTIGTWQNGRFTPDSYAYAFSLIGYGKSWRALFDWQAGMVTIHKKKASLPLQMDENAVDPLSLSLNLGMEIASNPSRLNASVVDEDEIDQYVFEIASGEDSDTALGCLNTTRLQRVRKNSKRLSLAWYAQDYNYIPVRMQHQKKKGNNLEMRITALSIAGKIIDPVPPCA